MDMLLKYWPIIALMGSAIVSSIIWNVRLAGKVNMNCKVFNLFKENSEKRDEKIDKAIDELFNILRDVQAVVNKIDGWQKGIRNGQSIKN